MMGAHDVVDEPAGLPLDESRSGPSGVLVDLVDLVQYFVRVDVPHVTGLGQRAAPAAAEVDAEPVQDSRRAEIR
jgi:hypothetical protein